MLVFMTCHDFVTRAMRSGNASHVVMKQVGHKTDSMLRRYQLVDERDLMELRIETSTLTQEQKQAEFGHKLRVHIRVHQPV